MISSWTALILIRNLMWNNIDHLVFCYFPIQQKLCDIKVIPSFSSTMLSVSRRAAYCLLCGKVRKVINPHMELELALSADTFCLWFLHGSRVWFFNLKDTGEYVQFEIFIEIHKIYLLSSHHFFSHDLSSVPFMTDIGMIWIDSVSSWYQQNNSRMHLTSFLWLKIISSAGFVAH